MKNIQTFLFYTALLLSCYLNAPAQTPKENHPDSNEQATYSKKRINKSDVSTLRIDTVYINTSAKEIQTDSNNHLNYSENRINKPDANSLPTDTVYINTSGEENDRLGLHLVAGIFFLVLFVFALIYIFGPASKRQDKNGSNLQEDKLNKLTTLLETIRETGVEKGIVLLILLGGVVTGFINYFGNGIDIYIKLYVAFGIAGLTFSTVFFVLVTYLKSTNTNLKAIEKHINEHRDPLAKAKEDKNLSNAQRHIAQLVYDSTANSATELTSPKPEKSFSSITEYNNYLNDCLQKMIGLKHGAVYAVCSYKEWDKQTDWIISNKRAIEKNISVSRIFLPFDGTDKEKELQKDQYQAQSKNGIRVLIPKDDVDMKTHLKSNLKGMDRHFGFVIFEYNRTEKEVVFHHNPNAKGSIAISDKLLVAQFKAMFNNLQKLCKVYREQNYSHDDTFSDDALNLLETIYNNTRYLRNHRMSDLQIMFLLWRFKRENHRLEELLSKEVTLEAKDKFSYLAEVYGELIERMQKGYSYYVVTLPEIWGSSVDNLGSPEFMQNTIRAVKKEARVFRVFYILGNELSKNEYQLIVLKAVSLMEKELLKENLSADSDAAPKFYVDLSSEKVPDEWPLAYMINREQTEWLRIESDGLINQRAGKYPNFKLKYYSTEDTKAETEKDLFIQEHTKLYENSETKSIAGIKKYLKSKCEENFKVVFEEPKSNEN